MFDIVHDFPIQAGATRVFEAVSTPAGLDAWWTKASSGKPAAGSEYELSFGPKYEWRARVTRCEPPSIFELKIVSAEPDWRDSLVSFELEPRGDLTWVRFAHRGWPEANEHYRGSCYCWAMYLRVLRRNLEHGELVPYERRLQV